MKKRKKINNKPEILTTEHYFSSPIYYTSKPEWVKDFNTASDPYIKQARLNNLKEIKKRNKKLGSKRSFYNNNGFFSS